MDSETKITAPEDDSTDAIKRQMEETRDALTDKLEALEQHVVGTVQDAAEVVASVRTAVTDTVESVTTSVRDTVDTVTETVDLRKQFDRHPWPLLAGAAAVGFIGGSMLSAGPRYDRGRPTSRPRPVSPGGGNGHSPPTQNYPTGDFLRMQQSSPPAREKASPGWMDALRPAAERLCGVAIGASLGVVRDLLTRQMPTDLAREVSGIIDDATVNLGGRPIRNVGVTAHESSGY